MPQTVKIKSEMFLEACSYQNEVCLILVFLRTADRMVWEETHKVDSRLRQQRQRCEDATGHVHVWQEGYDVVLRHRAFDLRRRTQHGGGTVWNPECKVQLGDTKRDRRDTWAQRVRENSNNQTVEG